jgi:hypothetical protein
VRPHASIDTPVEDEYQDESVYLTRRGGRTVRRGARRLRGRWTVGYRALTRGQALALRSDLMAETLLWCPRTRKEGDPAWLEQVEIEVRLVSDLSTLEPLWRDAQNLWEMTFELEAVAPVISQPNTFSGGYYDKGSKFGTFTIEPYGDGEVTERTETRTFLGQTYNITILELGTPPIAAMRCRDEASRPDAFTLSATEQLV